MNRKLSLLISLLILSLLAAGCNPTTVIGEVEKLHATVQVGSSGSLSVVNTKVDLGSGESIRVSGGAGRARVTLVKGTIEIILYDSTDSSTKVSGSQQAIAYLTQGGLKVVVKEGSTCKVNVPNGGSFNIIGTEAFVIYNTENGYATAGNFDGTVAWNTSGTEEQDLPSGKMIDIGPDGSSSPLYDLPFDPQTFERAIDEVGSPIEAVYRLREENGIPLPGQPSPMGASRTMFVRNGDELLPGLAREWQVDGSLDENGVFWTLYLDPDAVLRNGEPFTAPYAAEVIYQSASPEALELVQIEPVDDQTLLIQFLPRGEEFRTDNDFRLIDELTEIAFDVQP